MSHDIWNPWHGCTKISEGCQHCYMYFLDKQRDKDGSIFHICKSNLNYPLKKDRSGNYKIKSGEMLRVCMTSDFFLEDADPYRNDVWKIIKQRSDIVFWLLTKRAERIKNCLPDDWNDGYDNVWLNVTTENQTRADQRIPILLSIPTKHKGIMCAPLIGPITIDKHLRTGQIEQVLIGGENYDGARPCADAWVNTIFQDCVANNVRCHFIETGTIFIKNGIHYCTSQKSLQSEYALYSPYHFNGKPVHFKLTLPNTNEPIPKKDKYIRKFSKPCMKCASRWTCNGCSGCNRCKQFTGLQEIPEFNNPEPYNY